MPETNKMTVNIMAMIAQAEHKVITKRTKKAIAAAKNRGTKLGEDRGSIASYAKVGGTLSGKARQAKAHARSADLAPILAELKAEGVTTLASLAYALNNRGIRAARGGAWSAMQVSRLMKTVA